MFIPVSELTPTAAINLLLLLYARQSLIAAMTQSDFLFIDEEVMDLLNDTKPDTMENISKLAQSEARAGMIRGLSMTEDRLTIIFPYDGERSAYQLSYAKLLTALIDRVKTAQRISSRRVVPNECEMKYYCNSLLTQLGFGGPDFKADRAVLLGHLTGYAAFKSDDRMEAHKARFTERRKVVKAAVSIDSSDV